MRWLLWCFCLLAESYETINHYHYHYFPAKQQLAFCSNDESSISSNRGNYVEFYILLLRKMTTQIKQEFRLMCGLCDIEAIFKKNWLLEVLLLMKQTLSD